jgi:hypothetical protein
MIATRNVSRNNNAIANDYYLGRYNNTEYSRSLREFHPKKKSAATQTRETNAAKYESRKNICDVCHTARSVLTNECFCD